MLSLIDEEIGIPFNFTSFFTDSGTNFTKDYVEVFSIEARLGCDSSRLNMLARRKIILKSLPVKSSFQLWTLYQINYQHPFIHQRVDIHVQDVQEKKIRPTNCKSAKSTDDVRREERAKKRKKQWLEAKKRAADVRFKNRSNGACRAEEKRSGRTLGAHTAAPAVLSGQVAPHLPSDEASSTVNIVRPLLNPIDVRQAVFFNKTDENAKRLL